jgi:hypothetical protein
LPRERVAGMLKGLSRDMGRNVYEKGLLEEAVTAEQAHVFYQAVSRGSSRLTEEGVCKEHQVYLFHPKSLALKGKLELVFPDAQWRRYKTAYMDKKKGVYYEVANRINECLNSLTVPDFINLNPRKKGVDQVATRTLKEAYFKEIDRHQWSNSVRVFKEEFSRDWEIVKQSFVRVCL